MRLLDLLWFRIAKGNLAVQRRWKWSATSPKDVVSCDSPPRLAWISALQDNYEQRLIDVEWEDNNTTKDYIAHIDIYGFSTVLDFLTMYPSPSQYKAKMISTVNAQPTKDTWEFANIHISFGIPNLSMLTTVVDKD